MIQHITRCVLRHVAHLEFKSQMTVKKPLVMNQPQVGKLIRELWLETGLTQEQLAVELSVTCSSINLCENGRSKPSPAMQKTRGNAVADGRALPDRAETRKRDYRIFIALSLFLNPVDI